MSFVRDVFLFLIQPGQQSPTTHNSLIAKMQGQLMNLQDSLVQMH